MENIEIKITAAIENAQAAKSVQDLRKSLKELNSLALQTQGVNSKAFDKIASSIGNTQDRMEDLRDEFVAFKGSALEKFNATLQMTKEGFANLDLDKVGTSLKNLGKIIMANPLLLLATVVMTVVENFKALTEAGGFIGDLFKGIGQAVDYVIKKFFEFTDALGITDTKSKKVAEDAKKNAETMAKAYEDSTQRAIKANEDWMESVELKYKREIELAEASGKHIEEIEAEKNEVLLNGINREISDLEDEKRFRGKLNDDQKLRLKKLNLIKDEMHHRELVRLAEEKTANDKFTKEQLDAVKVGGMKIVEEKKKESDTISKINLDGFEKNQADIKKRRQEILEEEEKLQADRRKKEEEQVQLKADLAQNGINITNDIANQELMIAQEKADRETQIEIDKNERIKESIDGRLQHSLDSIQKEVDKGIVTQEYANEAKKVLEDQAIKDKIAIDNKTRQLQLKGFERAKKYQLAQVAINLASEISAIAVNAAANPANILTAGGVGIAQLALLSGIAVAKAAIQTRSITSQQPPAFAEGGLVTGPGTGTSDSINARLSNGESVINANSTAQFGNILSMINEAGGGRSFKGVENKNTSGTSTNNVSTAPIRAYVVESEISRSQKRSSRINRLTSY